MHDFDMQIQVVFMEYSRTKRNVQEALNQHSQRICEYTGNEKFRNRDISWHIPCFLVQFSLKFFLDIS